MRNEAETILSQYRDKSVFFLVCHRMPHFLFFFVVVMVGSKPGFGGSTWVGGRSSGGLSDFWCGSRVEMALACLVYSLHETPALWSEIHPPHTLAHTFPLVCSLCDPPASDFAEFCYALTVELANEQGDPIARQMAGLVLKINLDSKQHDIKEQLWNRWLMVSGEVRDQVKMGLLQTLASATREAAMTAAQARL